MRKFVLFFISLVLCLSFSACGKTPSDELSRVYVHTASEDVVKPSVALMEDGRAQFTFSAFSSYAGIGTYTVENDTLTIRTDDGEYHYVFKMIDDTLVFDEAASSENKHMGEFADGAVFE